MQIPDIQKVLVNIGLGFCVEMRIPEALKFVSGREAALDSQAKDLTAQVAALRARIKLIMQGLDSLRQIQHGDDS